MNKLTCASFFAGVGGIDLAFENHGFKTIYANEIDTYAAKTYEANFKHIKVDVKDIKEVKAEDIPDFNIMLAGFPCQAFSVAGYRKGFKDEKGRGTLFFELERILQEKKPDIVFLENVKNLVGHDNGNTFRTILKKLEKAKYYVKYQTLNGMTYGNVPQNRERIYIIGFKDKEKYQKFEFPKPLELKTTINDIVDFNHKKDSKYYYTEKNCSFYEELRTGITKKDTVYQWRRRYVRENKSNVCPTLTANMGTGGHNVPIVSTRYGIRKLTPIECFKFQGFDDNFIIPQDISNTRAYKQAGNSVVVSVISRIAEQIKKVL